MNRKSLRKKVEQILKDANIDGIGQDVFGQRSVPSNVELLPVALVYTKVMNVERSDEAPKSYLKELQVTIEILIADNTDAELADYTDDLSMAAENAIEASYDLEDSVEYANLILVTNDTENGGSSPSGSTKLTYNMGYYTDAREDSEHPNLDSIQTDWKMNGNENEDAQDITYL